ncbi:hypothetical protein DPMN_158259 [Dreissena polymorpha]|uniref:Uncharacterized protein n=1 Tax=Dreissena polymorpha TaxID=45954 RepID=A0A9D4EGZ8_DREPO|nr:hypothetical protein DPMN_158259 [Dreissena polymorpha]
MARVPSMPSRLVHEGRSVRIDDAEEYTLQNTSAQDTVVVPHICDKRVGDRDKRAYAYLVRYDGDFTESTMTRRRLTFDEQFEYINTLHEMHAKIIEV